MNQSVIHSKIIMMARFFFRLLFLISMFNLLVVTACGPIKYSYHEYCTDEHGPAYDVKQCREEFEQLMKEKHEKATENTGPTDTY